MSRKQADKVPVQQRDEKQLPEILPEILTNKFKKKKKRLFWKDFRS